MDCCSTACPHAVWKQQTLDEQYLYSSCYLLIMLGIQSYHTLYNSYALTKATYTYSATV